MKKKKPQDLDTSLATCSNPIEKSDDFKNKKSRIMATRKPKKTHIIFSHFKEKKNNFPTR